MENPGTIATAPATAATAAERARTVLATATSVRIGVLTMADDAERHLVAKDGSLWLQPAAESPARVLAIAGAMPTWVGTVTALDVASVPHADRLRGRVTLTGPMEAVREPMASHVRDHLLRRRPGASQEAGRILRMAPTRVVLEWFCEDARDTSGLGRSTSVPGSAYRSALPDPFADCEGEWLAHLHRHHATAVRRLAEHAAGGLDDGTDARPLLVDRHGLVLRVYPPPLTGTPYDLRIGFTQPVECACEGTDALDEVWRRAGLGGRGLDTDC